MQRIYIGIAAFFCMACENWFEYNPYELRLESKYKNINQKNIQRLSEQDWQSDTVRFVMMGDTQRWYDETQDFVSDANKRNIDFVIHGGDMSDFGLTKEFCWIHDIMGQLKVPYVALIGNHDHLGTGEETYNVMYGSANFSFTYSGVKFVCLNTNALENDYSTAVPDFSFIKSEIHETATQNHSTVVVMHAPPGDVVFNNNVAEIFHEYIKRLTNLRFCLYAHVHRLESSDMFGDGLWYYGCDCMKNRSYLLFTVTPENYTYEVVEF